MEDTTNVNVQSKKLLLRCGILVAEAIFFIIVLIVCISRIHISASNYKQLKNDHQNLLTETAKQRKNIAFFSKNIQQYNLKNIPHNNYIYEIKNIKEYINAIGLHFGFDEKEYKKKQNDKNKNNNSDNANNNNDINNINNNNKENKTESQKDENNKNSEFSDFVLLFEENKNIKNNTKNHSDGDTINLGLDELKKFIVDFTYSDKKITLNDSTIRLSFNANYEYVVFKIINIFKDLLPGYVVVKKISIIPDDNDGKYFYYDFKFKDKPIKKEIQDRLKCNVELQWIVLTNNK